MIIETEENRLKHILKKLESEGMITIKNKKLIEISSWEYYFLIMPVSKKRIKTNLLKLRNVLIIWTPFEKCPLKLVPVDLRYSP